MSSTTEKVLTGFLGVVILLIATFFVVTLNKSQSPPSVALPGVVKKTQPTPKLAMISGFVVPHHDIVKAKRAELFAKVAKQIPEPKTVILISPNHYESGRSNIQTTPQTWEVTNGTIEPNKTVIASLANAGVVEEPSSFLNEHGIKLILGDIKANFPSATVVPIIFKIKTPVEQVQTLHDTLKANCNDCLVIASVDFSHYQPALLANLHDDLAVRALENLDNTTIFNRVEVDSPPSLGLLTMWAQSHNTPKFVLHDHTNSGVLTNSLDAESTTHVFGWYETGDKTVPKNQVSFLIGGDMMFGRMISHTFLAGGLEKSVDKLGDRFFWGTDAGIVNLEGPVSDVPVPDNTTPHNLVFNFPPQAIDVLKYMHVNAASLANNHSANQGKKGLETTRKLLADGSIAAIGGPGDADTDRVVEIKGQNLNLQIIGVHTLSGIPDLKPLIQKLKQDPQNRVLVFPHWGAEYQYKHSSNQTAQAHSWIDAGTDIVIGAHPHVIEDSELYKGKPIIYSLGNLLFDQDFSKETQQELAIAGQFNDDGLYVFALPIQSTKYKPALMKGDAKKQIIDRLYEPFASLKQSAPEGDILFFPVK